MADSKLSALSEISVPALEDLLYTVDDPSGTPVSNKVSSTRLGGLLALGVCQGRLTLESGVPISSSDQTGKTNVYYTPFHGNRIALYDGTRWRLYTLSEVTLALGTLTDAKNYDVFIYDNSGTLTLEALAWTDDTTRATALTTQDGVYVKTGATTRRYLGTFRTTSTTTTEDSLAKRFLWNYYNRVNRPIYTDDLYPGANHTYSTASFREWRGGTYRLQIVLGAAEESVFTNIFGGILPNGGAAYIGSKWDGTSSRDTDFADTAGTLDGNAPYVASLGVGYHYCAAVEYGHAGPPSFYEFRLSGFFRG